MNKKPVLVIMAAGIGSRFGAGIKQLAKVGPSNEIIMDYSIYDAREAGFEKVIFIIRKSLEKDFKEIIGDRIAKVMDVAYAYQEKEDLPEGFTCPEERQKPWGTGHAILTCRDLIDGPFAVINADDYYGKTAFKVIYDFLASQQEEEDGRYHFAMAGFTLKNTLSDNGTVTRGVCLTDEQGRLIGIHETKDIQRNADGKVMGNFEDKDIEIDPEGPVSMNFWGFSAGFMNELKKAFPAFLEEAVKTNPLKAEFLLPSVADELLQSGRAVIDVLPTPDTWFGITYQADKPFVEEQFKKMAEDGVYPSPLF